VDRLVATIRGELSPEELRADLTAAMDAVAIMDAIYESARLRQWVRVPALA
jgi:predicted dehydrogenase